jgi:3-oxoadipate enol-lactonase
LVKTALEKVFSGACYVFQAFRKGSYMSEIRINNTGIFYIKEGQGDEVVVFSHGLLWSHKMFMEQIDQLKKQYTVIAYDHRGQGQSEVSAGDYTIDLLTEDAKALIEALTDKPVHFVGLSMGGFVGMRLAARYPQLIKSLILMETSANPEPVENLPKYRLLNGIVKYFGVLPMVADSVMKIMFAESWLKKSHNKPLVKKWSKELQSNKKTITKSVEAVLYRKGIEEEIRHIKCPAMIIVGDEDVATKPEKAKFIQMAIPDATLHMLPGAGHSSCIEKPEEVNRLLEQWLEKF